MIEIRNLVKQHVFVDIGDGLSTSMWYDKWCGDGPLNEFINRRTLYDARVDDDINVGEMINDGRWKWPDGWIDQFPNIRNIDVPNICSGKKDKVMWQTKNNQKVEFSTWQAWQDLRDEWPSVEWKNVIWFNQFIPKHAFILWLAVQEKLLTQDKMIKWSESAELNCVFCKVQADSHDHLFFKCDYARNIWKNLSQNMFQMQEMESLQDVIKTLANGRVISKLGMVVNKLIVAAAVYYIWQERNARVFKNQERNVDALCQVIRDNVRYKIMTIKVRKTRNVEQIADMWELSWINNSLKAK